MTPWTVAHQSLLSMGLISQAKILEWVAISFSRGLCDLGIKPASPTLVGGFFTTELPGKPSVILLLQKKKIDTELQERMERALDFSHEPRV